MRLIWATSPAVPVDRDSSAMAAEDCCWPTGSSGSRASSDFPDDREKTHVGAPKIALSASKVIRYQLLVQDLRCRLAAEFCPFFSSRAHWAADWQRNLVGFLIGC